MFEATISLLIACAAGATQQAAAAATLPLALGTALDRPIPPGQTHHYEIDLQAGEYLQVDIQQHGVDVSVEVTAPAGDKLMTVDSPGGEEGPEPVAFVAGTSGRYRLAVIAPASARTLAGARYELRVTGVRAPTDGDLLRARAVRDGDEVLRLLGDQPATHVQEILDRLHDARDAWAALGESYLQLFTDDMIGYVTDQYLDQLIESEEHTARALALARQIGSEFAEAVVSGNLASVHKRLGHPEQAEALWRRALQLDRAAHKPWRVAVDEAGLGGLLVASGRPQEALDGLQDAVALLQRDRDPDLGVLARARGFTGDAYMALGEFELAIESYQAALGDKPRRNRRTAMLTRQIGYARFQLGHVDEARAEYARALDMLRTLGNRTEESATTLFLGILQREEGQLAAARDTLQTAIPAFRAGGARPYEARAQCELGETLRRLGDLDGAGQALAAAMEGTASDVAVALCTEMARARLERDRRQLAAAALHAGRAIEAVESLRLAATSPRWRASALAAHEDAYALLVDVRMRQHESDPAAGHDAAALAAAERARARTLLDALAHGGIETGETTAPELQAEAAALHHQLNLQAVAREDALADDHAALAKAIGRGIDAVSARLALVEADIRRASPRYAALTDPEPLDVAAIRARVLDPETQLVEYALGDERSFVFVVSPAESSSFVLAPRKQIEAAARQLHGLMSKPAASAAEVAAAARELGQLVVAPAAGALTAKRMLVVAPGALQYVPFAALSAPDGRSLAARYEVVSTPSASVIATLRGRSPAPARKTAAVFADPVFEPSDPRLAHAAHAAPPSSSTPALRGITLARLPFSSREMRAIAALETPAQVMTASGFAATREAATAASLADYRIVHFATHALLNASRPDLSGVVLSLFEPGGRPRDGFLRLHDVYGLHLGADLVVLSACQTALGREMGGEGLIGLTRGFMYAGAKAVVASLWQVDDESTAELMSRFYRGMLKEHRRPADALRQAQLEVSRTRRWSAPFYWAGFVLQGDWR